MPDFEIQTSTPGDVLANKLGCSYERMLQIEQTALRRLRPPDRQAHLQEFAFK
jgi:DNA-directed RNA polymerase sigma subunit (sigma70/sigma32)